VTFVGGLDDTAQMSFRLAVAIVTSPSLKLQMLKSITKNKACYAGLI